MEVPFLAIRVELMSEALVNVSSNYNCSKVDYTALVKFGCIGEHPALLSGTIPRQPAYSREVRRDYTPNLTSVFSF